MFFILFLCFKDEIGNLIQKKKKKKITSGKYKTLEKQDILTKDLIIRDKNLSKDCRVWSWGWGCHGALGHGLYEDELLPKPLSHFDTNINIVDIACGWVLFIIKI